jgi:hypothetical protein
MSNAGGDALEGFMGGSAVWAPLRGLVGGCGVPADLKIVEIDVQPVLADARDLYKVQQDWKARRG